MRTVLAATLLLAACGPAERAPETRAEPADVAVEPTPPGDTEAPRARNMLPAPQLEPLTRADFESRLDSGAGCTLSRDGADLVVTVAGDGVARFAGRVVDLSGVPADLNGQAAGGRFTAGAVTIAVAPAPDLGEGDAADGMSTRPVRVTVARNGDERRFEAAWSCGS